ncbi:MAG: hypothetical protein K6E91_03370 [Butyrivibrio sp.]|nr:hypothetical protein [Butyrivibrio sp.]
MGSREDNVVIFEDTTAFVDENELLKLFGAMDERTRQIMLVQMRAVARF